LGDQPGQERLDTVNRPPQVDVDHEAPIVVAGVHDRACVGDARVVEHHVHVTEHTKRLIGQALDIVELAHVADDAVCVDAVGAQYRDRVVQRGPVDVAEHHPGAAARELPCRSEADAVRTAGDDCCALVEILHAATLRPCLGPDSPNLGGSRPMGRRTGPAASSTLRGASVSLE
jgi:hypothetical protein